MTHAWLVVPPGASDDSDIPAVVRLPSSPTMPAAFLSLGLDFTGISDVQASLRDYCPYAVGTSSTDWTSGADFSLVTPTIAFATAAVTCGEMFMCEENRATLAQLCVYTFLFAAMSACLVHQQGCSGRTPTEPSWQWRQQSISARTHLVPGTLTGAVFIFHR